VKLADLDDISHLELSYFLHSGTGEQPDEREPARCFTTTSLRVPWYAPNLGRGEDSAHECWPSGTGLRWHRSS
jgi:hypothetical protein